MLDATGSIRTKFVVHMFAATGARPDALSKLKLKDVEEYQEDYQLDEPVQDESM